MRNLTDEIRAKLVALTMALMDIAGELPGPTAESMYIHAEEWHDHYRHMDGTDLDDRLAYDVHYSARHSA